VGQDGLLKDLFPSLYALAQEREASVADYHVQGTNNSVWMPVFMRDGFADDDGLLKFFSKLSEITIDASSTDKVRWKLNTKGCFTVRSFYLKLLSLSQSTLVISVDRAFPHQLIWRNLEDSGTC